MTAFNPCPKPPKREKKQKKYLPRATKPIAKSGKPNPYNKKRQAVEMPRKYGSSHRRRFVRGLPCSACGAEGFSQNAHVVKIDGGMGRKGSYLGIAPLCGPRFATAGCHALHDQHREKFYARFPWFNPEVIAAETERAYNAFCEAEGDNAA